MWFGRALAISTVAAVVVVALALPAVAHGENDARPLLRESPVGPYTVSLWQVIGDHGNALPAHLIVTFTGTQPQQSTTIWVEKGSTKLEAVPSTTTEDAWETVASASEGDILTVVITSDEGTFRTTPVLFDSLGIGAPMQVFIALAVFFTTGTAYWLFRRSARVFGSQSGEPEMQEVEV